MLSLRGPLCAGEAFELEAAGPRGGSLVKGCCAKEGAHCPFLTPPVHSTNGAQRRASPSILHFVRQGSRSAARAEQY